MAKPFVRVAPLQQNQPIVDRDGKPNPFFMRALNDTLGNLGEAINAIAALPDIQQQLMDLDAATQAALDLAQGANDAVVQANLEQALVNSYIEPASVTTATNSDITVVSHNRIYADSANTSVAVNGDTITNTYPTGTVVYVFYDDPTRAGGFVTFQISDIQPVQTGDTHVVEAVRIPALGDPPTNGGGGPPRPGNVLPEPI